MIVLAAAILVSACSLGGVTAHAPAGVRAPSAPSQAGEELESLLRGDAELTAILDESERRRVQVLVAIATKDEQGAPSVRRLGFRVDAEYFYPASAVKLATAVAALEKLDEQRDAHGANRVTLSTPLRVTESGARRKRTLATTLRHEIEQSLVISDNDAHNRLFHMVGRDELEERMARIGLASARIVQALGDGAEALPPAFEWLPDHGEPIYVAQRLAAAKGDLDEGESALVGTAHLDEAGRRVSVPMDFSGKNRITLRDLQDLLIMTVRPDLASGLAPRLAPQDREALLAILGTLPSEVRPARYTKHSDDLLKPLHRAMVAALPDDRVRVLGKGGRAFGFAVENAYAVDETTGRSFFVAATIYANENDTLNDDHYDYATVAEPFMARLGVTLARALLAGPRSKE